MSKRLILILILVALAGAGTWYLLGRDGGPVPLKRSPSPPPVASFTVKEVRGVDAQDRPEAGQKSNESSAAVVTALNDLYTMAFLRPSKWAAPSSPSPGPAPAGGEIAGFFTGEAQATVAGNLGGLGLAEIAPRLKNITPTRQELTKLSFGIESDLSAPIAIATVTFEATATTKNRKDGPVKLVHNATYWFVQEGTAFKILAYSTELRADTVSTGSPSSQGLRVSNRAEYGRPL